jgi:Zn finger protein HypA/HybF involved in hydrogenase expression
MSVEATERRAIYLKRKKSGCCPRCGSKIKKNSGFIYCDDCRGFFRNYNQEISESINKDRRTKYNKRKKNNECPRCGVKLGKKYDKTICPKCLGKQYEYNYGKRKKTVKSGKAKTKTKKK